MQDRYVGDIGDFVKYGLLRALGKGKRLGVAWYLPAAADLTGSGDGRHNGRSEPHRKEIQKWMNRLPSTVHAYYWRRYSNRTFFVINPDSEIERRLDKFVGCWGRRCGELIRG